MPLMENLFLNLDHELVIYNELTRESLDRFPEIDEHQVVYSGHFKGAYVALMAAGLSNKVLPKSLVLFAPAGYDEQLLSSMNPEIPLSIIWGQADRVISNSLQSEIYEKANSVHKQFIEVSSYSDLSADHFFPMTESYFFGGKDGISALHYYGSWKWLIGAVRDVQSGGKIRNRYLYGRQASSTGAEGLEHAILRSW